MVWFGNLENGAWFVNRKSPVSQLKRVAAIWNDEEATWTVHNIMADGTIQYSQGHFIMGHEIKIGASH